MTDKFNSYELQLLNELTDSLSGLLKGNDCNEVLIPAAFKNNEIKSLAIKINETTQFLNAYTESLFSLSRGDLTCEIPKSRMKIRDGLKNLQASLNHLTWKTQRIANGDFNQTVDFMGEFSKAFNSMTQQLKQAFETIKEQNSKLLQRDKEMTRDLKLAAVIQKTLISDKIDIQGVNIHSIYKPMILVGGDIYSIIEFRDKDQFGIFIADVNGHGVHAALVTGILKVLINTAGDLRRKPSELLLYINSRIVDLGLEIYFTAFYGICDLRNRLFTFSRGGHNKPFLLNRSNNIIELDADGPILGVMKEITIEESSAILDSGDKLLFYTDGLTEAENIDGEQFEQNALPAAVKKYKNLNIADFIEIIYKTLTDFRGSEKFNDDVCILGIEIL